ncbi:hypothetical protein [Clostridium minihomine]|uniref:hypothetical protein n=1 Tax=Clostridium minihomine TaxID=2045012 RepID=UPI000C786921|nr:hypothetical protein [Clostridium minihomine]
MKYVREHNGILLIILVLCLLVSMAESSFAPWNPSRRWFSLSYCIFFALFFIDALYDNRHMRRYYQEQGTQASAKIRLKQILANITLLILCASASVLSFHRFLYWSY